MGITTVSLPSRQPEFRAQRRRKIRQVLARHMIELSGDGQRVEGCSCRTWMTPSYLLGGVEAYLDHLATSVEAVL